MRRLIVPWQRKEWTDGVIQWEATIGHNEALAEEPNLLPSHRRSRTTTQMGNVTTFLLVDKPVPLKDYRNYSVDSLPVDYRNGPQGAYNCEKCNACFAPSPPSRPCPNCGWHRLRVYRGGDGR